MHPNESKQVFCVILYLHREGKSPYGRFFSICRPREANFYRFYFYCGSCKHMRCVAVNVQLILIIKILLSLMAPGGCFVVKG